MTQVFCIIHWMYVLKVSVQQLSRELLDFKIGQIVEYTIGRYIYMNYIKVQR